jgi:hypothetical protein
MELASKRNGFPVANYAKANALSARRIFRELDQYQVLLIGQGCLELRCFSTNSISAGRI